MSEAIGRARVRVDGVDVARALASAIMIQGHAYDGWVDAEGKASAAYAFTRLLGTLPLPSFLLLAGAAIALRVESAIARAEDARVVRRAVVRRGLEILAIGYAVNAASALMDGWDGPETFFRVDVLPLIGLSIATLGLAGIRGAGPGAPIARRSLALAASAVAIVPILLCVPLSLLGRTITGPAGYVAGLFIDVPIVSRMPFVPLASWMGIGVLVGLGLARANRTEQSPAGAPRATLLALLVASLVLAIGFSTLTTVWVEASGLPLDRTHPAVVANALDLAARGVFVLAAGTLISPFLGERVRRVALRFGRGSLVAYVFHVPLCYGALGAPLRGQLSMGEATLGVLALEVLSYGVVFARDRLREPRRRVGAKVGAS